MKLTFEQWKQQVNTWMIKLAGVDCDDIEDWDYFIAWDCGMSSKQAAKKALKAAGW